MSSGARQHTLDEAFERIEESILPSLSLVLDSLLDAAALARPGVDAEIYAAELRTIGAELESLPRQLEAMTADRTRVAREQRGQRHRAAWLGDDAKVTRGEGHGGLDLLLGHRNPARAACLK